MGVTNHQWFSPLPNAMAELGFLGFAWPHTEGARGLVQALEGEMGPRSGVTVQSPDLAKRGLLVAQAHHENAVSLAQAAQGPGRQG